MNASVSPLYSSPDATPHGDKLKELADAFDDLKREMATMQKLTIDKSNAERRLEDVSKSMIECREELARAAERIQQLMQTDPLSALVVRL